jgi:hypothetical protein
VVDQPPMLPDRQCGRNGPKVRPCAAAKVGDGQRVAGTETLAEGGENVLVASPVVRGLAHGEPFRAETAHRATFRRTAAIRPTVSDQRGSA